MIDRSLIGPNLLAPGPLWCVDDSSVTRRNLPAFAPCAGSERGTASIPHRAAAALVNPLVEELHFPVEIRKAVLSVELIDSDFAVPVSMEAPVGASSLSLAASFDFS